MTTSRIDTDVVVLGSGAAGLTAAYTAARAGARVALLEKADLVGGTSAWSGGHVWIPNHPYQESIGVTDSVAEARTYIMSLSRGLLEERLVDAYLRSGPEMVRHLDEDDVTDFYAVADYPDYHSEHPGAKAGGGRTIECPPFSYQELGEWAAKVTKSPYILNPYLTMSETSLGSVSPQVPDETELRRRRELDIRGAGQALVGRLLKGCLRHGVEPVVAARGRELIVDAGKVVGVSVDMPTGTVHYRARAGVILACGGFEWNEDFKRAFLRGPLTLPVSIPTNTGDGLRMAMRVGAMLSNMREAWWMPAARIPEGINAYNRWMMNSDRTRPRCIIVNRYGRRFTNESANYNAFGAAFHVEDVNAFDYPNLPSWLIFDQGYLEKYGTIAGHLPGPNPPSWLTAYPTLEALAKDNGIDGANLAETVARWNIKVADGDDPDFGRGLSAHDRWWGDKKIEDRRMWAIGPIDRAPYYAIQIESGALGTKGGPRVDPCARVLDLDGDPVPGLYAAGNVMGSPFGATYGGAGGTLGPAMVFGYLAGNHAAALTCSGRR